MEFPSFVDRLLLVLQLLLVSSSMGVAGGDNMHIDISIVSLSNLYFHGKFFI